MRIKVDSRNKKPTVFDIAAAAVAAAVIITVLLFKGGEKNLIPIIGVFLCFLCCALVMLIVALIRQIEYNPYSYNTIFYTGFSIFDLSVIGTFIIILVKILADPGAYTLDHAIWTLLRSSWNYIFFTFPVVLVFSVWLCVSNISLIRHEGLRTVNILGIILSFLLVGGAVFLYAIGYYATGSEREVFFHDFIVNLLCAIYLYFECMLIGTVAADIIAAKYEPDKDKDFLIILGCGIKKDGTPTRLLQGRIDRALEFYRRQKEKTGKEIIFIPSGGKGPDEIISESASIKNYLLEQGIPEEQIIEENRSTNTAENMKFSKEIITAKNPDGKIAFSTTNYHVFRSGLLARRVKMRAVGMGAATKWYFWPNASVREFVGLLTKHLGKQILIISGLLIVYIILTFLAYR